MKIFKSRRSILRPEEGYVFKKIKERYSRLRSTPHVKKIGGCWRFSEGHGRAALVIAVRKKINIKFPQKIPL